MPNQVFLIKCQDYNEHDLADCCNRILTPCISATSLSAARVLLKPNLITGRTGKLACTEGKFILAVAKWFVDHNARVLIGDSPAFGTATSVLKKIGIIEELQRLPITITDFTQVRSVTLPSGVHAPMAVDALDCDLLVNMPRVKAHSQFRVTLAVKNLFGCLVGMHKPFWHMVHGGKSGCFASHLVELLSILPDTINLVDGITAMHQTGPIGGKSFPLGVMACSTNPVAVDRALLAVLAVSPEASPLMEMCIEKGCSGTDLESLHFPFLSPQELAVDSFVVPAELNPVRFNPFRFIRSSLKRLLLKFG